MNICSNQIKEVILHRFKVNSLQKLLIHINFLLAFSVLFCSHSAFGQSVEIDFTLDSMVVDMGFTDVYWSKRNLGAEDSQVDTDPGNYKSDYYDFYDVENASNLSPKKLPNNRQYSTNQYWRVPNKQEADALVNQSHNITNDGVYFTSENGNTILIPTSGYYNGATNRYSKLAYFWTCTSSSISGYAFRFVGGRYGIPYCEIGTRGSGPEASSPWKPAKLPIRPVIDKVTLTYKVFENKNNTATEKYSQSKTVPKGTEVTLTSIYDDCHTLLYWKKKVGSTVTTIALTNAACGTDDDGNGTLTVTVTENNATYEAIFEERKVNIRATTDSNKGWVGLNVWK